MSNPKISIITVCYNAAKVIERTLRSVSNQINKDFEYIVIDGASSDDTLKLVRDIAPFAIVHSEKDKGIYDAMNKAIDMATGDYLWFINAGDAIYDADTTDIIIKSINNSKVLPDIVYGDTLIIDSEDRSLGLRRLRPPKCLKYDSFKKGMLVCHQSILVNRDIADKYDMAYRFSADFDWCVKAIKKSKYNLFIDMPLSKYLNEGTTTQNHRKSLIERFNIMTKHYGLFSTIFNHIMFVFVKKR